MHTETIPLKETFCFSKFFLDYIDGKDRLKDFYNEYPKVENFKKIIEGRKFDPSKRAILTRVLADQYAEEAKSASLIQNLELLKKETTFTITTGHQLNIFTGPLYFIYKLVTAINTCKELKKAYPEYDFVPVYWMASEDHDFDEINHFFLGEQKVEWSTDQTGAVGRFSPNGLREIADKLTDELTFFKEAYTKATLADAVRCYVNKLFGEDGLMVIDADSSELKMLLKEVMKKDILHSETIAPVGQATKALEKLRYKPQISAREINFFFLDKEVRGRIEKADQGFEVMDYETSFTESEMTQLIDSNPENFSPNVTLRPLYQEIILPNIAYIGGPAEVVYWLQLKEMFDHYKVSFPILLPRNSALIIPAHVQDKWTKIKLPFTDIFVDEEAVLKKWVKAYSPHNLNLSKEIEQIRRVLDSAQAKAAEIDTTLVEHLEAVKSHFARKLTKAQEKLIRAEKRKNKQKENQINAVKAALFPNGTLQERKENFIKFYLSNPNFLAELKKAFDPFTFEMYMLFE